MKMYGSEGAETETAVVRAEMSRIVRWRIWNLELMMKISLSKEVSEMRSTVKTSADSRYDGDR